MYLSQDCNWLLVQIKHVSNNLEATTELVVQSSLAVAFIFILFILFLFIYLFILFFFLLEY